MSEMIPLIPAAPALLPVSGKKPQKPVLRRTQPLKKSAPKPAVESATVIDELA